jgi:hypothetical protein
VSGGGAPHRAARVDDAYGAMHGFGASAARVVSAPCRVGGTAYAMVSNTIARKGLWVRIPHSAPEIVGGRRDDWACRTSGRRRRWTRRCGCRTTASATVRTLRYTALPSRRFGVGGGCISGGGCLVGAVVRWRLVRGVMGLRWMKPRMRCCWDGIWGMGLSRGRGVGCSHFRSSTTSGTSSSTRRSPRRSSG